MTTVSTIPSAGLGLQAVTPKASSPATTPKDLWLNILSYGPAGVGKTYFGVSGFWQPEERRKLANGLWVTFGREDNIALNVPEAFRQWKGKSLRLVSPLLDSSAFVQQLSMITKDFVQQARAGTLGLDVLVFDGLAEFDMLFEETNDATGFDMWNQQAAEVFGIIQRTDARLLNCHVVWTTRVTEKRKPKVSRSTGKTLPGDPDFVEAEYYPALRGELRHYLAHYFDLVLYQDQNKGRTREGLPIYKTHMAKTGDFLVKNVFGTAWAKAKKPPELTNTTFWEVAKHVQDLVDKPVGGLARQSVVLHEEPKLMEEESVEQQQGA